MIKSLSIAVRNSYLQYPKNISELFDSTKFLFKEGLNVIVGSNGSGKSTIMDILKCGTNVLTDPLRKKSVTDTFSWIVDRDPEDEAINADTLITVGKSHNDFDIFSNCDNFMQFMSGSHLSEGQTRVLAMHKLIKRIINRKSGSSMVVFFDEPTLSLSMSREMDFFKTIEKLSEKVQIIIATNSTFCYGLKANYIELESGYVPSQINLITVYASKLLELNKINEL